MNPSTDPVLQHNPQPWQAVNSVELYVAGAGDEIPAAMDEQMARDALSRWMLLAMRVYSLE